MDQLYEAVFIPHTTNEPHVLTTDRPFEGMAEYVKKRNARWREKGFTVQKIDKNTWEYTDENCVMIGDDQGCLVVRRVRRKAGRR